jgi:hypothetical protein
MWCPSCESNLSCNCPSCSKSENVVIFLLEEEIYQCPLCEYKFTEGESADYEWDRMIENWSKVATKAHCYHWILDKRKIESELNFDDFMMGRCFFYHFKQNPDNIDIIQFKRNYKLNEILN